MKTSFLDYYKMILEKVSFDDQLFVKEYCKAVENLCPDEKDRLDKWLKARKLNFDTDIDDRQLRNRLHNLANL